MSRIIPKIKLIVFDLDGTLIRSHENIFAAMKYAVEQQGITDNLDKDKFMNMIGHHFREIFAALDVKVNDTQMFIECYKKQYFKYIHLSEIYPFVEATIRKLKQDNFSIGLLTTKLQDQADLIIDHFNLRRYFDVVTGRKNGIPLKPAPDQLLNICRKLNVKPENTLMVGDSELDIRCGKNAGAATCAVTFGYRSLIVLNKENPDYIIDSMDELLNILNNRGS